MPFWGHSGVHVRAILALKTDPELGHRSDVFLVQFWRPKCGPKRPEMLQDLPRRPERPPERGPGRCYVAALALYPKPAKKHKFLQCFGALELSKSDPRTAQETLMWPCCWPRNDQEDAKKRVRRRAPKTDRKRARKVLRKVLRNDPETSLKRGPKRGPKMIWSESMELSGPQRTSAQTASQDRSTQSSKTVLSMHRSDYYYYIDTVVYRLFSCPIWAYKKLSVNKQI